MDSCLCILSCTECKPSTCVLGLVAQSAASLFRALTHGLDALGMSQTGTVQKKLKLAKCFACVALSTDKLFKFGWLLDVAGLKLRTLYILYCGVLVSLECI